VSQTNADVGLVYIPNGSIYAYSLVRNGSVCNNGADSLNMILDVRALGTPSRDYEAIPDLPMTEWTYI